MATDINTILSWFKTGLKPTQTQFWASWSSFWHKDEAIPQSSISNLASTLNAKAEKDQFDNHLTDPNAHAESIGGKLDKGAFPGTAENLDNRIAALEMPDKVLKYGQINVSGLNLTIAANAFAWVLNQINFLTPGAYAKTITAATDGMYRTDIVAGNAFGSYELIQGTEASTGQAATEPNVPSGKIKVGYVLVFGNTIAKSGNSEGVDLSGELKFPAYPNTRNDGQISMNKVLGTDAQGNLKLYTMAVMPAPFLEDLIPDSHLPSTTGNFILKGSFFTPSMTVVVQGQTMNYKTFISDNEVRVNLTTGATPGNYDVTLDNGIQVVFSNVLLITSGTIFEPVLADWASVVSPLNVNDDGEAKIGLWNFWTSAVWTKEFDKTKDFRVQFKFKKSPLGDPFFNGESGSAHIQLLYADNSDTTVLATVSNNTGSSGIRFMGLPMYGRVASWDWGSFLDVFGNGSTNWLTVHNNTFEFRYISGILYAYTNGSLAFRYDIVFAQNVKLKVNLKSFDVVGIKYIEF